VKSTQHNEIAEYRQILHDNVFSCMEMSKQSWIDTMMMPVKTFSDYLKWKSTLEEEKKKLMEEEAAKGG